MKTKKKIGLIVLAAICVWVAVIIFKHSKSPALQPAAVNHVISTIEPVVSYPLEETVTITRVGSKIFDVPAGYVLDMSPVGDNVPLRIIYNGGKSKGGIEKSVPPSKDWVRLGWKPEFLTNVIRTVSWVLETNAPVDSGQVYLTIKPPH